MKHLPEIPVLLLEWYDRCARVMPWRGIHDPYRTWVSESMLQQTRVETVLSYYPRFLERFPSVSALAEVPAAVCPASVLADAAISSSATGASSC